MKKIIAFFVVCVIVFSFAGCTPLGWDSEAYEAGSKALNIIEKLNNGEVSKKEAADLINSFHNAVKSVVERMEKEGKDDVLDFTYRSAFGLQIELSNIHSDLAYGITSVDTLKMERELRETLSESRK